MASFNPFEIRNPLGQRGEFRPFHHQHHKHEGSPLLRSEELSDEEVTRLLFKTKPRRKIRYALLIKGAVLVVCLVALFGLGWICLDNEHSATPTLVELHRPHILPTLLSVVDPQTNLPVYALNNTLYERMLHSVDFVDGDARQIQRRNRRCEKECELPQLWLDKASIPATPKKDRDDYDYDDDENSPSITLSWSMGRDGKHGNVVLQDEDVIALYCGNNENYDPKSFLEAATIAQAKATSVRNGGSDHENTWFIPRFPILRQESCHFRLYLVMEATRKDEPSTEWQFLHVGSTGALTIENAKETPTAIHLAYSDTFSTMVVQFTTGNLTSDTVQAVPVVRHSQVNTQPITSNHDILSSHFEMTTGTSDTYFASDMCQEPANRTEAGKFYPPGMFHTVKVQNLKPSTTYQYQVGVSINGNVALWSEPSTFTTSSMDGDASNPEFSYIVYGDQGCPDSGCHVGKKWLSAMMERETKISSVHHFGDISYADGASHVWDAWFQMIEPFSTRIPLMIAIGNHEYDHVAGGKGKDPSGVKTDDGFQPTWGNFMVNDSGGECGVPMARRFRMPSSAKSNGVFWYSYNHAIVHTIVISSEHDLSIGSPQYEFLEHDLEHVDRTVTPWVVLESHRPLYEGERGEHWTANTIVAKAMREEIEDLLYVHKVDLVLAGHYHEYHRTCSGLYRGECDSGGPIHITIGAAGAPLDNFYAATTTYDKSWTARFLPGVYGYGKLDGNETALLFSFARHGDIDDPFGGQVLDSVSIPRRS